MSERPHSRKQQRQEDIVAQLRANPTVRIAELAQSFGVSTETIRRDLDALSEAGAVNRTYGGAARSSRRGEAALDERLSEHVAERQGIAQLASQLVEEGELIMIDGGSTTIHLARQLAARSLELTVLTNSLGVAAALGLAPSIKVVLCPGDYHPFDGIVSGAETMAFLERFFADRAFIGASGLTEEGVSEAYSGAAWVKRHMLGQSRRRHLLLDSSKFGALHHDLVCPLRDIDDLITDRAPEGALGAALTDAEVALHTVPDGESAI